MFIDCLWEHAERGSTGEWVLSGDGEIHVFFVAGRFAWASSTLSKRAFTAFLQRRSLATPEQVRAALQEGRQRNLPFGKVLLAHGVCTEEVLREAARFQLRAALDDAEQLLAAGAPFVFLNRAGHPWSDADCFDVTEFLTRSSANERDVRFKLATENASGAIDLAWVDLVTGTLLASRAEHWVREAVDYASLVRAALRLRGKGTDPIEIVLAGGDHAQVVRAVDSRSVVVGVSRSEGLSLGMLRLELEAVVAKLM